MLGIDAWRGETMTAGGDGAITRTQAAVWCGTCGIPYAAETVYCANCGAELAALEVAADPLTPQSSGADDLAAPTAPQGAAIGGSSPVTPAAPDVASPLAARVQERQSGTVEVVAPPVTPLAGRTLDEAFPNPPRGLIDRVRQRQQAMSEDEIDAAAAAIIAQARHADRLDSATEADGPRDALALLAALAPDPVVEEALQRRRERDRAWLIGGIVCCVLLILFALAISRTMSIGILRQ